MPDQGPEKNLLIGILALQMGIVTRDALVRAMRAWVVAKAKPIEAILLEQGGLKEEDLGLLRAVVDKHQQRHGNDLDRSLREVGLAPVVCEELKEIADPVLHASLACVGGGSATPPKTLSTRASAGPSTPSGMRFRVLRPHQKGGLGEVLIAFDEELHREVALKEIQARYADHAESRTRFLLEAEITGSLEHPGVVPVYGFGQYADGRPYYAMRFIRGESLKDAIERLHQDRGRSKKGGEWGVELHKLLNRFLVVCNTIGYAHSRGVLHRDLKPSNIMLGSYGETIVVDWGLAKSVGRSDQTPSSHEQTYRPSLTTEYTATQAGAMLGTPQYMSPEQADGRIEELSPASDIYSLGATLYCLLTGKPPVDEADIGTILQKVVTGRILPPRQHNPAIDPALEAICLKAMALKPAERYESARALADDIEHWMADEAVAACPESVWRKIGRWGKRHRLVVFSGVVSLLTLLVALAVGIVLIKGEQLQTEEQRKLAEQRERAGRRLLYVAHINLAESAWENSQVARLRELIDFHQPKAGQEDLRGFEWYYFARLARSDVFSAGRHEGSIRCLSFSPDGRLLATGGADRSARVWRITTGEQVARFLGHVSDVSGVCFSPDGALLATAGADGSARLWDMKTQKEVRVLRGHRDRLTCVAFAADGKVLATGSADNTVKLWDPGTGELRKSLQGHSSAVNCLAFSADGKILATGSADHTVRLWDTTAWRADARVLKHAAPVRAVAFSQLTNLLASASQDGTFKLWEPSTGKELAASPAQPSQITSVSFSPDKTLEKAGDTQIELLAASMADGTIKVWTVQRAPNEVRNYTDRITIRGHRGGVNAVLFSPDGSLLATGSDDTSARLWKTNTGQAVAIHRDMQTTLRGHSHWVYGADFSPDGRTLATCSADQTIKLWDLTTNAERSTLRGHARWVYVVKYARSGKRLVTASEDRTARIWDAETGDPLLTLRGHADEVWDAAFSPDGNLVATGCKDGTVKLWEASTGTELATLSGHRAAIWGLAFSPNGKLLATASDDRTVRLWDVSTRSHTRTLEGYADGFTSLAFSPDGKYLAAGNKDTSVRIWGTDSFQELAVLRKHASLVFKVSFSPDGRSLASCSWDQTVQLWNVATWLELCTLRGHEGPIFSVCFSPNGDTLATTSRDRTARLWHAGGR